MSGTVLTGGPGGALTPLACGVSPFQLLQWRSAIRLEAMGIRFRKSVRAHACRHLGLGTGTKGETVVAFIEKTLAEGGFPVSKAVR